MATIKNGDVVRLKSGGPSMTVKWVDEKLRMAGCAWFVGTEHKEADFDMDSLEPVAPKS